MFRMIQPKPLIAGTLLTIVAMASAQTERQSETFPFKGTWAGRI